MKKYFILVTILSLLLTGCKSADTRKNPIETPTKNDNSQVSTHDSNCVELQLYYYNNEDGCIPTTSLIPDDSTIDAQLIVNEVTANFDEKVIVTKVEEKKDCVTVYFDSESAPIIGVSAYIEESMLDCIAYSLIDNLDNCNRVYFRTDVGQYKSDDIILEYDEPYLTR